MHRVPHCVRPLSLGRFSTLLQARTLLWRLTVLVICGTYHFFWRPIGLLHARDLRNVPLLLAPNRTVTMLHPHNDSCPSSPVKRIAIADIHDGTRIDIPSIFLDLGHEILNLGFKGRNGPYPAPLARMTYPSREYPLLLYHITRTQLGSRNEW